MQEPQDKRLTELLERWHSGEFTRADEQELLALTRPDEFRRDAAGGYWDLPEEDHQARLRSLRARLRAQNAPARRVDLTAWLAAAATVALLVWALWQPGPEPSPSPAIAEKSAPAQPQNIEGGLRETTVLPPSAPSPAGKPLLREHLATGPAATADNTVAFEPSPETAPPPQPSLAREERAAELQSLRTAGGETKTTEAPQDDGLDASYGNATEKKQRAQPDAARAKQAPAANKATEQAPPSQPVGGWDAWQEHLRRNARLPEAARQNNVSGKVALRFRLDESGQPVDILVTRSLGFGCDEEAVRLVKSYPWKRGSDPVLSVEIPFVR